MAGSGAKDFSGIRTSDSDTDFRDSHISSISRRPSVCSRLVDLVVCVGRHRGGGHRSARAGERFVGLVAEDIAEVSDRRVDLGER